MTLFFEGWAKRVRIEVDRRDLLLRLVKVCCRKKKDNVKPSDTTDITTQIKEIQPTALAIRA